MYIDGEALEEDYLKSNQSGGDPWTVNAGPYEFKVPQDSYLLLGDNRNGSSDARVWEHTYVSKDDILAKAIFRYYPFDRFGVIASVSVSVLILLLALSSLEGISATT